MRGRRRSSVNLLGASAASSEEVTLRRLAARDRDRRECLGEDIPWQPCESRWPGRRAEIEVARRWGCGGLGWVAVTMVVAVMAGEVYQLPREGAACDADDLELLREHHGAGGADRGRELEVVRIEVARLVLGGTVGGGWRRGIGACDALWLALDSEMVEKVDWELLRFLRALVGGEGRRCEVGGAQRCRHLCEQARGRGAGVAELEARRRAWQTRPDFGMGGSEALDHGGLGYLLGVGELAGFGAEELAVRGGGSAVCADIIAEPGGKLVGGCGADLRDLALLASDARKRTSVDAGHCCGRLDCGADGGAVRVREQRQRWDEAVREAGGGWWRCDLKNGERRGAGGPSLSVPGGALGTKESRRVGPSCRRCSWCDGRKGGRSVRAAAAHAGCVVMDEEVASEQGWEGASDGEMEANVESGGGSAKLAERESRPGVAVRLRARLDVDADHRGQHARSRLRVAADGYVDARVCIMLARNRRARTRTARCSHGDCCAGGVVCCAVCKDESGRVTCRLQACKCKDRTLGPVELSTAAYCCKAERASFTVLTYGWMRTRKFHSARTRETG
ncbi:hypothetical protein L1887_58241 [Cichorium endivia]|nr:hypothetical protein L1887_58241 [Cichorium endivia]